MKVINLLFIVLLVSCTQKKTELPPDVSFASYYVHASAPPEEPRHDTIISNIEFIQDTMFVYRKYDGDKYGSNYYDRVVNPIDRRVYLLKDSRAILIRVDTARAIEVADTTITKVKKVIY